MSTKRRRQKALHAISREEEEGNSILKSKKLTREGIKLLEAEFRRRFYPESFCNHNLSRRLGVSKVTISQWFVNRYKIHLKNQEKRKDQQEFGEIKALSSTSSNHEDNKSMETQTDINDSHYEELNPENLEELEIEIFHDLEDYSNNFVEMLDTPTMN